MGFSAAELRRHNFAAAVEKAGGVPAFCRSTELNPDYVRQLLNGKDVKGGRNIGDRAARKIEALIGKDPNWLDQAHGPVAVAQAPARPPTVPRQVENDIDALRLAVGALFTDLASTRPAEGARLAERIRATVPENFQDRGLLFALLEVLDTGARAAAPAKGRKRARPPAGRAS